MRMQVRSLAPTVCILGEHSSSAMLFQLSLTGQSRSLASQSLRARNKNSTFGGIRIRCGCKLRCRLQMQAGIWCCCDCGVGWQLRLQSDPWPGKFTCRKYSPKKKRGGGGAAQSLACTTYMIPGPSTEPLTLDVPWVLIPSILARVRPGPWGKGSLGPSWGLSVCAACFLPQSLPGFLVQGSHPGSGQGPKQGGPSAFNSCSPPLPFPGPFHPY